MTDITNLNLEAAIIDQKVAGAFTGMAYAFVAVINDADGGAWALGVAVANESGFNPLRGKTFDSYAEAMQWADGLNAHIGLSKDVAFDIIASTMGGRTIVTR